MDSILHGIFKLEVHASLRAEEIGRIGPVGITNSMMMAWLGVIVLALFGYFAGRNAQLVPRGAQNVFEMILEALLTLVETTAGHYAARIFPLVATLFIYIITANYMGLLPGVGTILIHNPASISQPGVAAANAHLGEPGGGPAASGKAATEKQEPEMIPLLRSANADVNMTLGMALISFFFIHYSGIAVHGLRGYWKEDLANPPLMAPIKIVIECFVPVSLSMRLFGNIFGGEMLMTVMGFPIIALPFMIMELLFGLIQALIFSILTLIFTSLASHLPEGHETVEGHHGDGGEEIQHAGNAAGAVPAAA